MQKADQHKVVVLEPDQERRNYIRAIVSACGYVPIIFEKETICLDNLRPLAPELVITGPLSDDKIYRFVNMVKMTDFSLPLLIITPDRSTKDFAASGGFSDVKVLQPTFKPVVIKSTIESLIRNRREGIDNGGGRISLLIGNSAEMLKIKQSIPEFNRLSEPVLIQGEPGTGKELVARTIHDRSERRNHPFVKINLAELNSGLLDELLFGTAQGDSNGSYQALQGLYNSAGGGTLLLDDAAKLPASLQSRLLAVFDSGFFVSGSTADKSTDLKIVVSCSENLDSLVHRGKFRQDLYFRMNAISIMIPPLRHRISDIPLLTDFFADQFCLERGVRPIEFSARLKDNFCRWSWPGNVRELKAVVRRAIMSGNGDYLGQNQAALRAEPSDALKADQDFYTSISLSDLQNHIKQQSNPSLKSVRRVYLLRTERKIIKKALERSKWNRKKAAELLGISYKSLLNKIKEYELA